ncbi:M24 family metallopeptidase [Demequina muriae]|uniref:M24 family metallopeptidase n=1 Tax=Demequina muriae TaxID=3051664 RepID=A0ABT8GIH1_9MICO|nr:M24 family metallopeptidase [Demequina sp. EGI L300058]MDN4481069.1 M24 family metallopeptidase [Demequina sp. EGI L300058]
MTSPTDRPAKIARIQATLHAHGATAMTVTSPENLAWLLDGARVTVPYSGPPVVSARVSLDGDLTVTALANEAQRMRHEELDAVDIRSVPWHDDVAPFEAGALRDTEVPGVMRAARASLLPVERRRYAQFCAEAAARVGAVARAVARHDSERDVAARLVAEVARLGADPIVVLVGGETRTGVQHPLPTTARIGRRVVIAVGARRHGMIANLTRVVSLGAAAHAGESALREVEADAWAATRPGRPLGEVLSDIAIAYQRHGLGADAWLAHHQGGPTGYVGRDPKVMPGETAVVHAGQAFAWNPWVQGAKAEDTVIVDRDGTQVLTVDPDWPTQNVRGVPRPATLELE